MSYEPKSFFEQPAQYLHKNFGIRLRKQIIDRLLGEKPRNQIILDIGCGDGSLSVDWLSENEVYFCDFSKPMLDLVESRLQPTERPKAHFLHTSLEELKVNKKPNVILCIGVLAHVPSIQKAISTIADLSGRETKLVLQMTDDHHPLNRLYHLGGGRKQRVNKIDESQLLKSLNEVGFGLIVKERFQLLLPGMGRLPDNWLFAFQSFVQMIGLGRLMGQDIMMVFKKK
jgi:SAM-dependent methyltransferase